MKYKTLSTLALAATLPFVTSASECDFTRNLDIGSFGSDVKCLQEFLNRNNYGAVESGPGSPGLETQRFGSVTKRGVQNWQRANGLPSSGFFGPQSRALYESQKSAPANSGQSTDTDISYDNSPATSTTQELQTNLALQTLFKESMIKVENAQKIVSDARGQDKDVTKATEVLDTGLKNLFDALFAYFENKPSRAIAELASAVKTVENIRDQIGKGGKEDANDLYERADTAYDEARDHIREASRADADEDDLKDAEKRLEDAKDALRDAKDELRDENWTRAIAFAQNSIDLSVRAEREVRIDEERAEALEEIERAEELKDDARDAIRDAEEDGIDEDDLEDLERDYDRGKEKLDDAEDEFDDADWDAAIKDSQSAQNYFEQVLDDAGGSTDRDKSDAEDALEDAEKAQDDARDAIRDAEEDGIDEDDLEDAERELERGEKDLERAEEHFEEDEFENVIKDASKSQEHFEESERLAKQA